MKLSVVILNYNVKHFLELCLQSVIEAVKTIETEIIVVDNLSNDGSAAMVALKFPEIIVIQNKENYGFSKGNNIGVDQAKGEYICVLNPDTVVAEDTFINVIRSMELQNNIGIAGCRLIDGGGQFLPESKREVPTPLVALKKFLGRSTAYYANAIGEYETGEVPILVGAFMMLKRELYNSLKGFDDAFFMYGEDIDLSYRALKLGYKNWYVGSETVIHFKGESTLKDKMYAKRFFGAMHLFYKKHFKKNILVDFVISLGIKWFYFMRSVKEIQNPPAKVYQLVSNTDTLNLKQVLKPFQQVVSVGNPSANTEIIFDANYLKFKTIITSISSLKKNIGLRFKLLPKNSNFILGSDYGDSRGEIRFFKTTKK